MHDFVVAVLLGLTWLTSGFHLGGVVIIMFFFDALLSCVAHHNLDLTSILNGVRLTDLK